MIRLDVARSARLNNIKKMAVLLLLSASGAHAASFDCAKATRPVERAICGDLALNKADTRLGEIYQQLRNSLSAQDFAALRQGQRQWLQQRDAQCPGVEAACLLPLYQQRISALIFRLVPEYPVSAAGRASGIYHDGVMELHAEALSADQLQVYLSGVEPTMARWICDFSASGTISRDGSIYFPGDTEKSGVHIIFQGDSAQVSEEGESSYYCGHGGRLSGTYRKQD
jgi:uncharacterized protein YecT (DUF1311 family)